MNPLKDDAIFIGLGSGMVAIYLFHKICNADIHGLILKDTGEAHEIGSDCGFTAEDHHKPEPGEIYIACSNRESAVVLRDMAQMVVDSFDEEKK